MIQTLTMMDTSSHQVMYGRHSGNDPDTHEMTDRSSHQVMHGRYSGNDPDTHVDGHEQSPGDVWQTQRQ